MSMYPDLPQRKRKPHVFTPPTPLSLNTENLVNRGKLSLTIPPLMVDENQDQDYNNLPTLAELANRRLFTSMTTNLEAAKQIRALIQKIDYTLETTNVRQMKADLDAILAKCGRMTGHSQRPFDIDTADYGFKQPQYKAFTCIRDKYVYKVINCNNDVFSTFMVMKEIAFQQFASQLASSCSVEVPVILRYGRVVHDFDHDQFPLDVLWYIKMTKIQYPNLKSYLGKPFLINNCEAISRKINEAIDCLGANGLYHNDYHPENVFLNQENGQIGLIDYGIAETYNDKIFDTKWRYTCDTFMRYRGGGGGKKQSDRKKRNKETNKRGCKMRRRKQTKKRIRK